jgi:hypothetical protein
METYFDKVNLFSNSILAITTRGMYEKDPDSRYWLPEVQKTL